MLGSSQGSAHWPLIHSFTRNVCSLPRTGLCPAVRLPSLQGTCKKTKQNKKPPWCVAPPPYACATECQLRAAAGGQVRSLFSHKDNTIILKRLWSPVIESSKGSWLLRGGGGQLFESGGVGWGALTSREQTIPEMDDLKSPAFACGISSTLVTWQDV